MALFEQIAVTSPTQAIFTDSTALVDGQTDTALPVQGSTVGLVFPSGGWVVALTAALSAATGAGALSVDVKVGSTQKGIDMSIDVTDTAKTKTFGDNAYRFNAGDKITATYTSGTLTTNGNITVGIFVVLDDLRG